MKQQKKSNETHAGGVVILASPVDAPHIRTLEAHLAPLVRAGTLSLECRTPAGQPFPDARARIDGARLVVALLSADAFADDAVHDLLVYAVERRRGAVLPVLLRPCLVAGTIVAPLTALPREHSIVTSAPQDAAWLEVVEAIRGFVSQHAAA